MQRRQRRTLSIVACVVAAILVLAAVAWWFRAPILSLVPTPPVVITEHSQGMNVHLLQGQHLEVRLRSNQLTSGVWQLGIPLDFLPQSSGFTFTPDANPVHPGDGYESVTFLAAKKGEGPLFLDLVPREDQNSLTPQKSFRVVVIVE